MKAPRLGLAFITAVLALGGLNPAEAQRNDPLPRFESPVCPGIMGLELDSALTMVERIRQIAGDLGIRLANGDSGDCEPNILVAFVEGGQAFLHRLQQNNRHLFAELSPHERRDLLASPGPAHVLTTVRTRSRDGMPLFGRENLVDPPQTSMWSAHSRIYTATRNDITAALILFDRDEIEGLSIAQLADYAALRSLTRTLPSGESIADLFDADAASRPDGLTGTDLAFLQNLYRGIPNLPGSARTANRNRSANEGGTGAD